jgi:hypothetical protein
MTFDELVVQEHETQIRL